MARIRTIKPEFWTNAQVMECSTNARLLFIGTWNFCDDEGRHPLIPKTIKALIFPGDNITSDSILGMFDELSTNGLITRYAIDGKEYFYINGWCHQKIDKRQKPKFPAPSQPQEVNSSNGSGMVGVKHITHNTEHITHKVNKEEKFELGKVKNVKGTRPKDGTMKDGRVYYSKDHPFTESFFKTYLEVYGKDPQFNPDGGRWWEIELYRRLYGKSDKTARQMLDEARNASNAL